MTQKDRYLVISDLQIPFQAAKALSFVKSVAKEFNIDKQNILCVGDEVDSYFGSMYAKSPNISYSASQEIKDTKDEIRRWADAFPIMRLCTSNHGQRWVKKLEACEIPSQLIRPYREIIGAPRTWQYRDEWVIRTKHPFRMIHGCGYGGANGAKNAVIDSKISTVIGHLHSHAGISYVHTMGSNGTLWGFNTGCLVSVDSFAFNYGLFNRHKPILGIGVILDDGLRPVFIPYPG